MSGPCLGVDAAAFDPDDPAGREVVGEQGELVTRAPMPSMPLYSWNDPGGERYRSSYFDTWPGVWRHGDRVTFTGRGSAVLSGERILQGRAVADVVSRDALVDPDALAASTTRAPGAT